MSLSLLRVPQWAAIPQLVHGFLNRQGGVSRGPFATLNLSLRVGDDPACVRRNWEQVSECVDGRVQFATMTQVHGAHVVTVPRGVSAIGEADAMVTAAPGTALGVMTADCVPILMVAPEQRVLAAVHAGWRGTLAGVTRQAVYHMRHAFGVSGAQLLVALGPAIGGCCYEVSPAIAADLERGWGTMPDAIHRQGRSNPLVDLRRVNAAILRGVGVEDAAITLVGPCTRCAHDDFFSYRAVCGPTGRQLSFIGWQD